MTDPTAKLYTAEELAHEVLEATKSLTEDNDRLRARLVTVESISRQRFDELIAALDRAWAAEAKLTPPPTTGAV